MFIEVFRPAAVLVGGARCNAAPIARIARRYPHLVQALEPDRSSKDEMLRALADAFIKKRVTLPADAPWRDRCVEQFCAIRQGKLSVAVRAAMQFVAHCPQFAAPAAIEKPGIAAAMIGFRAVTIERKPGEPGLCASGRDAIIRRLTGPVFHIDVKVI